MISIKMISMKMISPDSRDSGRRPSQPIKLKWSVLAPMAIVLTLLAVAPATWAAHVNGTLTGYENPAPQPKRYLHFENRVTLDIYMTPTAADGSFAADLPPGTYRLRSEHGAILARRINVGAADIPLGPVSDLAPLAPSRVWHLQSIAPAQLTSAAPSTANIMTRDTTSLPTGELAVIGVDPEHRDVPVR
jgi:hypothetical protein